MISSAWLSRRRCHTQTTLTLRQCLEHVAQLGPNYTLIDQGLEWPAGGLLASLARSRPDRLDLPMYLRLPDAHLDGAICQLTTRGGYILCYRVRRDTGR